MKLRNKKTGAIYDVFLREREVGGYPCIIVCDKKAYMQSKIKFGVTNYVLDEYSSLAELNKEWEDYTPTEPLIKDEKIRKAVRAWAEANQPKFIKSNGNYTACDNRGLMIEFNKSWTACMQNGERYTITELCGEEEE